MCRSTYVGSVFLCDELKIECLRTGSDGYDQLTRAKAGMYSNSFSSDNSDEVEADTIEGRQQ
jgi:hypothetical protein